MGKLREGILSLQKTCLNMEPQITVLVDQQDDFTQQVYKAGERIKEGLNALALYLIEKLKKEGKSFDTEGNKSLKDEMDSNVAAFGKGIAQAKADVKGILARLNGKNKESAGKLLASLKITCAAAANLRGIADKKKSKLLKSAKYKAKIGGYLTALTAIDDILGKQEEAINAVAALDQSDSWVERNYKFTQDMTLTQIRGLASVDFNSNLKDFNLGHDKLHGYVRKFRNDFKSMGPQLAMMKKWTEEADGMEEETEEK